MNSFENEKQLIKIIRAALNSQKVNISELSNELGNLAKRNKVFNLLYLGTGNERAKKRYKEFLIQTAAQDNILLKMSELFESRSIYLMPIKGAQTRKRYPKPELRAMNDIDVLCKAEQHKQVKELMGIIGYDRYRSGRKHEVYFIAPHVTVEVHYDLVDGEQPIYYEYYQDIWQRAVPKSGCRYLYEMTLEDEYIYNIVHLAGHFKEGGAGVRFFADLYIYEQLDFDRQYVEKELTKLDLFEFYQNIRALAEYWFKEGTEQQEELSSQVLKGMEAYVLSGGLFGEQQRKNDFHAGEGKITVLRHNLFPNYNSMKSMYPWLQPPLLPLSWGLRAFGALRSRKDNVESVIKNVQGGNKEEGRKIEQFYEQCGLSVKERRKLS